MMGVDFVVKTIELGSISVFVLKDSLDDNSLASVLLVVLVLLVVIMVVAEMSKQR